MQEYILIARPTNLNRDMPLNVVRLLNDEILQIGLKEDVVARIPNSAGTLTDYARAVNILYQFGERLKQGFPEIDPKFRVMNAPCCHFQPRVDFPEEEDLGKLLEAFPDFDVPRKPDETAHIPQTIPANFRYEDDFSEHEGHYYCERCSLVPEGPVPEEVSDSDPHVDFCSQKVPKRRRGSPRAHCFGTRPKLHILKEDIEE